VYFLTVRLAVPAFLAVVSAFAAASQPDSPSQSAASDSLCAAADSLQDSLITARCDSLREAMRRDSIVKDLGREARGEDEPEEEGENDPEEEFRKERAAGYAAQFLVDLSENGSSSKEWATVIYVAAGVIVVGACILYIPKLIYDVAVNKEKHPVFQEFGARYAYSGSSWNGGGEPLYRHTHLAGARYTVGVAKPVLGLGLTTEGGYLRSDLEDLADPDRAFSFSGAYFLAGPTLRFAPKSPVGLGIDFLNGAGTGEAFGWISQGRFFLQARVHERLIMGVHIGALFYDLRFLDGLIYRRGNLNRDLTLLGGIETGFRF
jgi:hypothetical protein